jgi:hypothetical protein
MESYVTISPTMKLRLKKFFLYISSSRLYENIFFTLISTIILIYVTQYVNTEQKKLETKISIDNKILEQKKEAYKSIVSSISKLNNYILFDLESDELTRIHSFKMYDELFDSGQPFKPLPNFEKQLNETTLTLEENSIFLDKKSYENVCLFLANTQSLINDYFSKLIINDTFQAIEISSNPRPEIILKPNADQKIKDKVHELQSKFRTNHQEITSYFRYDIGRNYQHVMDDFE